MYSLKFFQRGDARKHIKGLQSYLTSDDAKSVAARAGVNLTRAHLFKLDGERGNKSGGSRSHFYAAAARSVHSSIESRGVAIIISKTGIAQRLFGGKIKPVKGRFLAIPNRTTPEAYGRRPREFDNLEVLYGKNGPFALAERAATHLQAAAKGSAKGRRVPRKIFFWLVDEVEQDPDPSVLPSDDELTSGVLTAVYDSMPGGTSGNR